MKEREISLIDLLIEILLHWRGIIVMMAVGGLLFGAVSYERSARSVQDQTALVDEMLDSANVRRMDVIFLVTSDDLERTYSVEKVYEDMLNSAELIEQMAKESGISAPSLEEVYSLERGFKETLNGSDTFRISIVHREEEICRKLAGTIIDYLSQKHDGLEEKMGQHEIQVLDQSIGLVGDGGIRDPQKTALDNIFSAKTMAEKLRAGFSLEELQYCILMVSGTDVSQSDVGAAVPASAAPVSIAPPRVSLRQVLFGMILGAVVYALAIFLRYMLNNRLRAVDSLQALYGIPQLGRIPGEKSGRRLFGFLDRWILALRYWGQRRFAPEEAAHLAAVAVKMEAAKNGLDRICFLGCGLKEQALERCQQMEAMLADEKIEVRILDNVLYNAESMEELGDMKAAVLVETAESTLYAEVAQELDLLERQGIMVLGGILMNA